jgi:CubicO group peptidase (beta-lactamase class C family)
MLADRVLLTPVRPESVGLSTDRLARLGRRLQAHIEAGTMSGAVTAVARRGRLVHLEPRGRTAPEGSQPMQPDSIFRLASMTKPVTAVAVLMLLEEALVRLDDPAAAYVPELRALRVATDERGADTIPAVREITLRDLLSHTSGLGSAAAGTPVAAAVRTARTEVGFHGSVADFMPRLKDIPLSFQPGTAWAYSGVGGFDVLGRIIEVVSGQTLDEFFRERIFEPLGMHDTQFYLAAEKLQRLVTACEITSGGLQEMHWPTGNPAEPNGTYYSGSGGLAGTASDYLRFAQMLLNGGVLEGERLLSPKTVRLMATNHVGDLRIGRPEMRGYRFGLGVQVIDDVGQARSLQTAGSFGWNGAFSTSFWVDPAEEMVHVLLTQTFVNPDFTFGLFADVETLVNQTVVE